MFRWVACSLLSAVLLFAGGEAGATEDNVPSQISDAVHEALTGWARFANSGEAAALEAAFVAGGPQHRQLIGEAPSGRGDGGPLTFQVLEIRLRALTTETAIVWLRVEVSGVGYESQVFGWDFDLLSVDGRWRVWTVVEAERPTVTVIRTQPPVASSGPPATTTIPSHPAAVAGTAEPAVEATASTEAATGTRIPAVSAWVIVVTVVGVAVAGYLAPRLDRKVGP